MNRSTYEKLSKEKSDPTKGKKGGVNTRRMFDNVIKKYEKEFGKAHLSKGKIVFDRRYYMND